VYVCVSRGSAVGIVTGYGMNGRGVGDPLHFVQTGSGAHPDSYPMSTGAVSPGIKWQGREAEHSTAISAEAKKMWIYVSTPQYVFIS
jgi:hypothetical protein